MNKTIIRYGIVALIIIFAPAYVVFIGRMQLDVLYWSYDAFHQDGSFIDIVGPVAFAALLGLPTAIAVGSLKMSSVLSNAGSALKAHSG